MPGWMDFLFHCGAIPIWCTGYHPSFSWIDIPVIGEDGTPMHERGVVPAVPGLYFVGLHFQYSRTSSTLMGVGRDAEYMVRAIDSQTSLAKAS